MPVIITEKKGNLHRDYVSDKKIDPVYLEWYESGKRILHKKSEAGREVICRFLNENQKLSEGDVLFEDDEAVVIVSIMACEAIVIIVDDKYQMASVCYEIGNKHLPLFYDDGELLVPFDAPLYKLLTSQGYIVDRQIRKLLYPLKTTVAPHGEEITGSSLFSKIMKLASASNQGK